MPGDTQSPPLYLLDVVVSIVIVTLMGGIGEEIGWRGTMLPHLLKLGAAPCPIAAEVPQPYLGLLRGSSAGLM